jgi:hypothetical protein
VARPALRLGVTVAWPRRMPGPEVHYDVRAQPANEHFKSMTQCQWQPQADSAGTRPPEGVPVTSKSPVRAQLLPAGESHCH